MTQPLMKAMVAIINILRDDMNPEQQGKLDLFMQMLKNA